MRSRLLLTRVRTRTLFAVLAAAAVLMVSARAASAHGLGDTSGASVLDFVPLGAAHMLTGWDHLLFIGGALLVAGAARPAVRVLSVFAAGHSTTLLLATLAGWRVSATGVDLVVAASVAFAGVAALRGVRPGRWFSAAVAAFGLVHGLGLATRLQDADLPTDGLLAKAVAFNVGVEIGQLIAVATVGGVVAAARRWWSSRTPHQTWALARIAAALVLVGSIGAVGAVAVQELNPTSEANVAAGCVQGPRTQDFPDGGGHTSDQFFTPTQAAPMADFGHSLADGYVAFLYRPDLSEDDVAALRQLVTADPGRGVLAGANPGQEAAVAAVTKDSTLTCQTVDASTLDAFANDWLSSSFR